MCKKLYEYLTLKVNERLFFKVGSCTDMAINAEEIQGNNTLSRLSNNLAWNKVKIILHCMDDFFVLIINNVEHLLVYIEHIEDLKNTDS